MTRKTAWGSLAASLVLSFSLAACKDTKTLQENEQLKAQISDLQRQNGQLGNNIETMTSEEDALKKENTALKAQLNSRKTRHAKKKASRKKRHSTSSLQENKVQWVKVNLESEKGATKNENI